MESTSINLVAERVVQQRPKGYRRKNRFGPVIGAILAGGIGTGAIIFCPPGNFTGAIPTVPVGIAGDPHGGLRVIRSGLQPTDKVSIGAIPAAKPGSKISMSSGLIQFGPDQG